MTDSRVVDPLRSPGEYAARAVDPPAGIVLYGPPGTGKTTLAHALAGELDRPLFELTPDQVLRGDDPETLLETVPAAKAAQPSVLCLDQFTSLQAALEEVDIHSLRATVSELTDEAVLIVVTVTDPTALPESILYADWIDDKIAVEPPDPAGRRAIFDAELPAESVAPSIDWDQVVDESDGLVAKDLTRVASRAADVRSVTHEWSTPSTC